MKTRASSPPTVPVRPPGLDATRAVLDRHLGSFAAGDLDALMSDYTERAVLFTADGPLEGPGPIRAMMSRLFAEFAEPGARFELHRLDVAGDVGFIVWSATTADNVYELATDTFVVQDGKIAWQSFVGKVVPRGRPGSGR